MRKIWGIPVTDLGWQTESGRPFDPDALYPVVDIIGNRIYGINKSDESDIDVVQSYHPRAQPNAALNFALMTWGDPAKWERPDISTRVVSCLGAPACFACITLDRSVSFAFANEWRINPIDNSSNQLHARQLVDAGDPINERLADVHVMAELDKIADDNHKELFRRAIALFGPPYDMASASVSDPMIMALDLLPQAHDPRVAAHYANRQRSFEQDIIGALNRLRS